MTGWWPLPADCHLSLSLFLVLPLRVRPVSRVRLLSGLGALTLTLTRRNLDLDLFLPHPAVKERKGQHTASSTASNITKAQRSVQCSACSCLPLAQGGRLFLVPLVGRSCDHSQRRLAMQRA